MCESGERVHSAGSSFEIVNFIFFAFLLIFL